MKHVGLIPQDAEDVRAAYLVALAPEEAVLSVADELVESLSDINCKVAQQMVIAVALRFDTFKDVMLKYFASKDEAHYGIKDSLLFTYFFTPPRERAKWAYLKEAIERIAHEPYAFEKKDGLDTFAVEVLDDLILRLNV